ncbi:MAG: SDR family NAD(P)-dependent oxidoreductase [Chlorobiales bacterium]|nr:SDR family NAD(P)-dependent oxidoreductase [Chlorobiales bacterium]
MKKGSTGHSLGVVITGGTTGLGYALASAFLLAGDRVVICGRYQPQMEFALQSLRIDVPNGEVYGIICDISDPSRGKVFAEFAKDRLGKVDRWINNAGTAGELKRPLWELHSNDIFETCTTNLSGSILMCAEAVRLMDSQPPSSEAIYHIFNMGFSSTGVLFSRSAVPHKTSKRGVAELTHFLSGELKVAGKNSIAVHELSPGLVLTRLLLQDTSPEAKRLFKLIAEPPAKVASILVPKIRSITGSNRRIRYQPLFMMLFRALTALSQIMSRDRGKDV